MLPCQFHITFFARMLNRKGSFSQSFTTHRCRNTLQTMRSMCNTIQVSIIQKLFKKVNLLGNSR